MKFVRTVCVPLHYETDGVKLEKLDRVTARLSYGVSIFLDIIRLSGVTTKRGLAQFEKDAQKATKLSAGFVQQCRDKAVWMWSSYLKLHKQWERKMNNCRDEKYLAKLKLHEPSMPTLKGKVPVRLDCRTANLITNTKNLGGKLVKPFKRDLALSSFWLNLSTLKKHDKVMLPLKLSNYHINKLKDCSRIIDCEIVKKGKKYYTNFSCEYVVKDVDAQFFRTVDLRIIRSLSTVLFNSEGNMTKNSFKIWRGNQLQSRLNKIDEKIKGLQRKQKWAYLKKVRAYRGNLAGDYMHKSAKAFAEQCASCKVFIGYPKGIKYKHFKGNGNKRHRKRLGKWNYGKQISFIQQACEYLGIDAEAVNESYTSKRCSNCGSFNTERPYKNNFSLFHCNDCLKTYNADFNSNINMKKNILLRCNALQRIWVRPEKTDHQDDCAPKYADDPA